MSSTVSEIYEYIDSFAPFNSAMDFDNVGLLVSCGEKVKKAVVCLDIAKKAIEVALENKAELIISHHPVIFRGIKRLSASDIPYMLIQNNISAICAHTNLDMAKGGVNDALSESLELKDTKAFTMYNDCASSLYGTLSAEMNPSEFAQFVKDKLSCDSVRCALGDKKIKTVAVCGGAGSDILFSSKLKADAFVTGEVRHHEFLLAKQKALTIVEAGHFFTEDVVIKHLTARLSEKFESVEFIALNGNEAQSYFSL